MRRAKRSRVRRRQRGNRPVRGVSSLPARAMAHPPAASTGRPTEIQVTRLGSGLPPWGDDTAMKRPTPELTAAAPSHSLGPRRRLRRRLAKRKGQDELGGDEGLDDRHRGQGERRRLQREAEKHTTHADQPDAAVEQVSDEPPGQGLIGGSCPGGALLQRRGDGEACGTTEGQWHGYQVHRCGLYRAQREEMLPPRRPSKSHTRKSPGEASWDHERQARVDPRGELRRSREACGDAAELSPPERPSTEPTCS